jgi:hypothetical protein
MDSEQSNWMVWLPAKRNIGPTNYTCRTLAGFSITSTIIIPGCEPDSRVVDSAKTQRAAAQQAAAPNTGVGVTNNIWVIDFTN